MKRTCAQITLSDTPTLSERVSVHIFQGHYRSLTRSGLLYIFQAPHICNYNL